MAFARTLAFGHLSDDVRNLLLRAELADDLQGGLLMSLFRQGRLLSGTVAAWLAMPRVTCLLRAMAAGAVLLADSTDDLARETSLLGERA